MDESTYRKILKQIREMNWNHYRELGDNIEHHYIPITCGKCRRVIEWANPVTHFCEGKEIPLCNKCKAEETNEKR